MKVRLVYPNFILVRCTLDPAGYGFRGPFEGCGSRGVGSGELAAASAGEDVPKKNDLRSGKEKSREGDAALVGGDGGKRRCGAGEAFVVAWLAGESGKVHGQERTVGGDEADPEVQLAEGFVHEATRNQRIPVIDSGKKREDSCHRHDHVEMRHDEEGVVQV